MNAKQKQVAFQVFLFVATFITTSLAGSEWVYSRSILYTPDFSWNDFANGMKFSVPLIFILTVHEFGHYFTAVYHKIKTSLPYYIPIPPIPFLPLSLGTMGAVIRMRSRPESKLKHFDIGLSGPLAGFIVALAFTVYGFATLPDADYIFQFHPEYKVYGADYAKHVYDPAFHKDKPVLDVTLAQPLLFVLVSKIVADPSRLPNPHELMHYPVLLASFFALLITAMNLFPVGQLDGGKILYGLVGSKKHRMIATGFFIALVFYSGLGISYIDPRQPVNNLMISVPLYIWFLYTAFKSLQLSARDTLTLATAMFALQFLLLQFLPAVHGYSGWLLFAFVIGRFIGVQHPPSDIEAPLDSTRVLLGWLALVIFILCFSPAPVDVAISGTP